MAFDAARQRMVLFGGWSTTGTILGDAWQWDGTNWTASFSTHYPPARWIGAMAYDAARQRVVLFGGLSNSGAVGDTWEWDGVDWLQRTPAVAPSARWSHALAYDSARQRTVLFGGFVQGVVNATTWEWDGNTWLQRLPTTVPPPRAEHSLAYDPVRQRTVMFGGTDGNNARSDTWEWDGTTWQQRVTTGVLLSGRREHAMAYDAARQRVVLFGGNPGGTLSADTVEWDGTVWTQAQPVVSPSARFGHAMAYDLTRQRLVLFSGAVSVADTWTRGTLGTPAVATAYGNGCGIPPVGFEPAPAARPIVGQNAGATITNVTTPLGAVAMGWSNSSYGPFTLPVTLGGIGMPGCDLLQSAEVLGLPATVATTTSLAFSLAIPPGPSLIGARVYLQAYVFAPGANALQVLVSNGIEWTFGDV
jgi:hypothetical protein